jgi:hypothetical protein
VTTENTRKALTSGNVGNPQYGWSTAHIVDRIEANPTVLLNAMVEDGMLEFCLGNTKQDDSYRIPKPHVHRWEVTGMTTGIGVRIRCKAMRGSKPCTERGDVSAILPIEVPS